MGHMKKTHGAAAPGQEARGVRPEEKGWLGLRKVPDSWALARVKFNVKSWPGIMGTNRLGFWAPKPKGAAALGGISKFDPKFARLTPYNPRFARLSKYNPGYAKFFDLGVFNSFTGFHDFLSSIPAPNHVNGRFCPCPNPLLPSLTCGTHLVIFNL
jgi:hypothetical protein